jgi:uncharacterized OB-fold protein
VREFNDIVYTLEYPYTRSTGPYVGPFLTGLRDGKLLANRVGGRTFCPPIEYDPATGASAPAEFVEVGPGATVGYWTWIAEPSIKHPFQHPFAFALITIDGSDVPFVHAVDAGSMDAMSTGMRVAAQYREDRHGAITDLYFVPEAKAVQQSIEPGDEPVTITEHLIGLTIHEPLFAHRKRFAQGLLDGKIIGQKSPVSGLVFVPGRNYDNLNRVPMGEADDVAVADRGSVTSYTVLTPVQYYGQKETEPYIRCSILLDGASSPIIGVDIRDIPLAEFRVGMRLQAVWRAPADRDISNLDNRFGGVWGDVIDRWEPTGEPDVDPDSLKEHTW